MIKKYAHFRALKLILELNEYIGYFDTFEGFKEATPYGGARKFRLTQPPVRRVLKFRLLNLKNFRFFTISIFKKMPSHMP